MRKLLSLCLRVSLCLCVSSALAQTSFPIPQVQVPTSNLSSTIAVTNTFQSIQAASASRRACLVQNNSSNTQWVFFGPIASATKAKSVVLAPGQGVMCNGAAVTLTDQISITGTATDSFYAGVQ